MPTMLPGAGFWLEKMLGRNLSSGAVRPFYNMDLLADTPEFGGSISYEPISHTNVAPMLDHEDAEQTIPSHPLGVKPLGNKYTATESARDAIGAFQVLPDEVVAVLLEYLDSRLLRHLGSTCKALYAFCNLDDLWKVLFIEWSTTGVGNFKWRGCWRSTYLSLDREHVAHVACDNLFSDVLYRPFLCANTSLTPYTTNIPSKNTIPHFEDLDPIDFASNWCDKPFILTKPVREWPVFRAWNTTQLLADYADTEFRAEAVDWPLKTYVDYMNKNSEESPLYLFDRGFVEKMDLSVGKDSLNPSYWIPDCFGEDLFAVLGDQRPDSRWLILGPARSGSTFHKDPNATSAWNAVLRGSKYWIMFPTNAGSPPPPGVYVSEDQSEVTSPLSIAEWLIGFHAEARQTSGCMEGICNEGEILHVPSGWWHLVVNLDASIAITQNFVPRNHLPSVLSFLKDKSDQISGFKKEINNPYARFVQCLEKQYPELLAQAITEAQNVGKLRKRKWDVAVGTDAEEEFGFRFGGDGDSDEEIP